MNNEPLDRLDQYSRARALGYIDGLQGRPHREIPGDVLHAYNLGHRDGGRVKIKD